jgi:hypothetical protein
VVNGAVHDVILLTRATVQTASRPAVADAQSEQMHTVL